MCASPERSSIRAFEWFAEDVPDTVLVMLQIILAAAAATLTVNLVIRYMRKHLSRKDGDNADSK